jgi:hypothetical protein
MTINETWGMLEQLSIFLLLQETNEGMTLMQKNYNSANLCEDCHMLDVVKYKNSIILPAMFRGTPSIYKWRKWDKERLCLFVYYLLIYWGLNSGSCLMLARQVLYHSESQPPILYFFFFSFLWVFLESVLTDFAQTMIFLPLPYK